MGRTGRAIGRPCADGIAGLWSAALPRRSARAMMRAIRRGDWRLMAQPAWTGERAPVPVHLDIADGDLHLAWSDGTRGSFLALWLRDNSPAPSARHASGQKLFDITQIDPDIRVAAAELEPGGVRVRFAPGDHEALYDDTWLHGRAVPAPAHATRRLWGAELAGAMPVHGHAEVAADPAAKRRWLADIRDLGFALLTGVPTVPGKLLRVADLFGFVRETNYGRLFEVRAEPKPINLAYTGRWACPATPTIPIAIPVPGLQLLHCLVSQNDGGESIVVDGFKAAALLRAEAPEDFALLTRHAVPFRFESADARLEARAPADRARRPRRLAEIRFNNRSIGRIRPDPTSHGRFLSRLSPLRARSCSGPTLEVGFKPGAGRPLHRRQPARPAWPQGGRRLGPAPPAGLLRRQGFPALHPSPAGDPMTKPLLADLTPANVVDRLGRAVRRHLADSYLGEPVTIGQHMAPVRRLRGRRRRARRADRRGPAARCRLLRRCRPDNENEDRAARSATTSPPARVLATFFPRRWSSRSASMSRPSAICARSSPTTTSQPLGRPRGTPCPCRAA